MKETNKIRLAIISTQLRDIHANGTINGDPDILLCSQSFLNHLGEQILEIIDDELKTKSSENGEKT
jgi:hypothetical protein